MNGSTDCRTVADRTFSSPCPRPVARMSRNWFAMLGRYATVMSVGVVVDYITFLVLYSFIGIPAAQLSARLAGAATGFFGHKRYTFKHRNWQLTRTAWQMIQFGLLWITNYVVSTWGIITVADTFDLAPPLAKVAVEVVMAPVSFLIIRRVIFRPQRAEAESN